MAESIATTLLPETENKRRSSYRSIADTSFFSYFLDCVSSDLPPGGLLPLHHEAAVEPVNSNQLVVGALLDDLTVIDNEYFVGVAHSFQPVSDHDEIRDSIIDTYFSAILEKLEVEQCRRF